MPIANCQLPIERFGKRIAAFYQSTIGNWQSEMMGWLTRPGSQQLGAKWVEVTTRRAQGVG
ncbi:MAG TPA: hypothetical protein VJM12_21630 [Pyrinomonadaceae bacterium]|nr:hypothetical protein [Pyrinomonadaceae bacterium]